MRALLGILVGTLACAHPPPHPTFPDAPLELGDDADREQAIDQLWALPPGAPRDAVRRAIADAFARRITDAIEEDKPLVAEQLAFELVELWAADPGEVGRGLAPHATLLHTLRATFAKSGAIEPTIAMLVVLAEIEPARRAAHLAEVDEILKYADELASTENGPEAQRAQPIALLGPTALRLPLPWLVDRYVALVEERQRAVLDVIAKKGATLELVRAHRDVQYTAHRIANVLAIAGRIDELAAHLAKLTGLGADRDLAERAEALAKPTAEAYLELAKALATDKNAADLDAALATCMRGLARFPTDASLLAATGEHASGLGRVDQPIALYEAALQADPTGVDTSIALRLGKLYADRIARLASGGRPGAATTEWRELARYTTSAAKRAPNDVWAQVAALGESSLGRGLVSQGRLADAEAALVASLDRAPSVDAYETLVTIDLQTNRLGRATHYATAGLALVASASSGDKYHRAKLERLAGDIARAAGKPRQTAALYVEALDAWASLGPDKNVPHAIAAERYIDFGRVMWFLGNTSKAIEYVQEAIDSDPDSALTCAQAVAFLLEIGRAPDAVDALHRMLGSSEIGESYKVYASLWVVGDARRRGEPTDRLAQEYLATRHGELWYELLAEAATGRVELARLRAAATTAPRKAELAFYLATLDLDPAVSSPAARKELLRAVVDAGLVLDAEYDLARRYLAGP